MDPFDTRRDDDLVSKGTQIAKTCSKHYQLFMDKITPHIAARWIFTLTVLVLFLMRVFVGGGWYIVCYALGIYYLNMLIDFLSPRLDPDFQATQEDLDSSNAPSLPTRVNDEFRPFIRRLPEYRFWLMSTRSTLISLFMSMFDIFDLPVYWPILVVYFLILTFYTLRRQIKHMYKHHYVPWNTGKQRFRG